MTTYFKWAALPLLISVATVAMAKLPALNDEAKAKAAEAAAKTVWSGKVDSFLLCKSQDKVAASYVKTAKDAKAPTPTPPCADPGPFVYTAAVAPAAAASAAKPIEAAGAHSPATTAASPHNTKQPDAVVNPAKKP